MNGATITCHPPIRETPGFGCPACSKPLNLRDRQGIARGQMACCGYFPTAEESTRWLKAADALDAASPTCGSS
jgi:hypothetical protein